MKTSYQKIIDTSWGKASLLFNKKKIIRFFLPGTNIKTKINNKCKEKIKWVNLIEKKIKDYFNGEKVEFDIWDHIDLSLFSKFQKDVYKALLCVDHGNTISYKELAEKSGYKKAVRAVGTAMAKNPFPLIIPCHRVIKSDGNMGNFGYGTDYKIKMLKLEKSI